MGRKAALTPAQVQSIQQSSKTLYELSREYGVALHTVFKAKHKKPPYDRGMYTIEVVEVEMPTPVASDVEVDEVRTDGQE